MTFVIHESENDNLLAYIDWARKKIADTPLIYEGISYQVSASVWVFVFREDEKLQKDIKFHALKYADQALYNAKEWGRNKTVIFDR
jgi:GGDEF domain-containing protein